MRDSIISNGFGNITLKRAVRAKTIENEELISFCELKNEALSPIEMDEEEIAEKIQESPRVENYNSNIIIISALSE